MIAPNVAGKGDFYRIGLFGDLLSGVIPTDFRFWSISLKPLILLVPDERIELPTFGLQNRCSTAELIRRVAGFALPASRAARKSGTL
jgi:hypothetical protein